MYVCSRYKARKDIYKITEKATMKSPSLSRDIKFYGKPRKSEKY